MERATVEVYESRGADWIARRPHAPRRDDARRLAALADHTQLPGRGGGSDDADLPVRGDLGCGAGRYLTDLGSAAIGIDAARTMLDHARVAAPGVPLVQADLEALPLRPGSLGGAWANNSYLHLPVDRLPAALGDLHRALAVEAPLDVQVIAGDHCDGRLPGDDIGGRYFASVPPERLQDLLTGAGFGRIHVEEDEPQGIDRHRNVRATARRARSLPDTVGRGMRLLVCGLNPSLYAADAGVGFARPGNRFWPAALAAGLVTRDRDPWHALRHHGVGMTDVVKRATPRSAELEVDEYRVGMARIRRLIEWLEPAVVCFVGLEGYRLAVDRGATAGWQATPLAATTATYLMPSTSGLNAHSSLEELTRHLAMAAAGPLRQHR